MHSRNRPTNSSVSVSFTSVTAMPARRASMVSPVTLWLLTRAFLKAILWAMAAANSASLFWKRA